MELEVTARTIKFIRFILSCGEFLNIEYEVNPFFQMGLAGNSFKMLFNTHRWHYWYTHTFYEFNIIDTGLISFSIITYLKLVFLVCCTWAKSSHIINEHTKQVPIVDT